MPRAQFAVLAVFIACTIIGGSNVVAVRISNRELAPFWGAGLRFAVAALLMLTFAVWRRTPLPLGKALPGVVLYGLLNFGAFYALGYWALLEAPAAAAAAVIALAPLLTFFAATALGMERFRWQGVLGGAISVVGVAVVFEDQLHANVPLGSLVALFLGAVTIATTTILLKRLPRTHPIGTNAVAMIPGAGSLLLLSALAGERPGLPTTSDVWLVLVYLVTVGAVGLFAGVVYVVGRWTASASAYMTVLFPIVTVALAAAVAGEFVSPQFVAGALLVTLGTYIGAILQPAATAKTAAVARARN